MNNDPNGNSNDSTAGNPAAAIARKLFRQCVHCGLCTSTCPTYAELGDENDGPRGRIQLMRLVAEGRTELTGRMRRHLQLCLDCRSCETACPSGVQFGRMIEPFRLAMRECDGRLESRFDWFRELVLLRLIPHARRMRRLLAGVRLSQRAGLFGLAGKLGLLNRLPGRLGRVIRLLPPPRKPGPRLPKFLPAIGRKRARVAFFVGCVADSLYRHVHWATLRVLQHNGCDVFVPQGQGCCGAIHLRSGDGLGARRLADANLVAFELDRCDAIVVNHSGCGAMMKGYGKHWRDGLQPHRERFADKVKDVHEFLDALGPVPPPGRIEAIATYHDACQLGHAQQISAAPRRLLDTIPGLQLRELPETDICCGSACTYNITEPQMSDRLGSRKMENILGTGAEIVLTADAGCMLQIAREIRENGHSLSVMHPMELLDSSYRGDSTS